MANETYSVKYHRLQLLAGKLSSEIPGSINGFPQLHQQSLQDGALSRKMKELIALSISITTPCAGYISYHVHDALMAGGPGLIYGCEALEALNQLQAGSRIV